MKLTDDGRVAGLDAFFCPRSVAIVGVSTSQQGFGSRQLRTLLNFGYKGSLYAVNARGGDFFGLKAYPSVKDIPGVVDLAIISVPAPAVASVIEDCLAKGIGAVTVLSAGFSELNEEGRRLEQELTRLAARGIRIAGPNCFGTYCPAGGLSIVPGSGFPRQSGPVGLVAQSGQFAEMIVMQSQGLGIRFSKVISYGNACDLNETDFLDYLAEDASTEIILGYIEGVRNGRRFLETVRRASRAKPVILWKVGLTPLGKRAAMSHTGSLGGDESAWDAFFKQTGAIRVSSLDELIDTALAFVDCPLKVGPRVALVSGGGGGTVVGADTCHRLGLDLPVLSPATQGRLRSLLPAVGSSVRNPVDLANPNPPNEMLTSVLDILSASGEVDTIILRRIFLSARGSSLAFGSVPAAGEARPESKEVPVLVKEKSGKPVFVVLHEEVVGADALEFEADRRSLRDYYLARGIPVYSTLERAIAALARRVAHQERQGRTGVTQARRPVPRGRG